MNETPPPRAEAQPGPPLPDVHMHLHTPADAGTGVVVSSERCMKGKSASFVRHVVIDVSQTKLAGNFRAGQSFGVLPPGYDDKGRPHQVRLYSIASPTAGDDGAGRHLSTTVKRTIDEHWDSHRLFLGVASNHLCDLQPGDTVRVTGPNGKRFVLPASPRDHDYLFFATGTGIAPFRGMTLDLLSPTPTTTPTTTPSHSPPRDPSITLVMGAPYDTDLLYDDLFTSLAASNPRFRYRTALSRQPQHDAPRPLYVQDRITTHREEFAAKLASDRTLLYICGITGMEVGIFQMLARILPPDLLSGYLTVDRETLAGVDGWTRAMINRQIKPTRRVFLEVYS